MTILLLIAICLILGFLALVALGAFATSKEGKSCAGCGGKAAALLVLALAWVATQTVTQPPLAPSSPAAVTSSAAVTSGR